ncbi:MAG: DUF3006 domain-containing protein [Nitrososphaerota archaeon]|jgi:hypothetical protein|nr:DUF3006 domain-containing protein [Candidatus Termiticorpusculum sp.]MDR0460980.1 DUF3006 domain-containing protein [Nitrososphaerota archaeon]
MIIVDRIENNEIAVCEIDGKMVDIPLSKISRGVQEGDVLKDETGTGIFYMVDAAKTEQLRAEITALFEQIKTKNRRTP